jgi:hypothetical protein
MQDSVTRAGAEDSRAGGAGAARGGPPLDDPECRARWLEVALAAQEASDVSRHLPTFVG